MPTTKIYAHPHMRDRARELRHPQTPMETKLWAQLRNRQLVGHKFRRQHPIDRFILDFYCVELKLAIEIDGAHHEVEDQAIYDALRTEILNAQGIMVVRFTNQHVFHEFEAVLQTIGVMCEEMRAAQEDQSKIGATWPSPPAPLPEERGVGLPFSRREKGLGDEGRATPT